MAVPPCLMVGKASAGSQEHVGGFVMEEEEHALRFRFFQ
jgi:hypothetical protein